MFAFTLVAGLLTASTFASPIEIRETPTDLHNKCDAVVVNADPPNDYCYQYCDLEVTNRIAEKRKSLTSDISCLFPFFLLPDVKEFEANNICAPQPSM